MILAFYSPLPLLADSGYRLVKNTGSTDFTQKQNPFQRFNFFQKYEVRSVSSASYKRINTINKKIVGPICMQKSFCLHARILFLLQFSISHSMVYSILKFHFTCIANKGKDIILQIHIKKDKLRYLSSVFSGYSHGNSNFGGYIEQYPLEDMQFKSREYDSYFKLFFGR